MNDEITITSGDIFARIDPQGAELQSLRDALGREYLWQGDPAWWTGRAPVLFPVVGALDKGRYRLGAAEYAMPKHGFARASLFEVIEQSRSRAVFRLAESRATREVYPFAFTLDMAFTVDGMALTMSAIVTNRDTREMPFSFGFHPAFQWPLPGGGAKDDHRVVFEHDEPAPIRRIGKGNTLLPEAEPTPVEGRELTPSAEQFVPDALIWDQLASRALGFGAESGSRLDLAFENCPYLGVWQKPGAPYLALEPWHGLNDPEGFAGDITEKPGIISLLPGDSQAFHLAVTIRP